MCLCWPIGVFAVNTQGKTRVLSKEKNTSQSAFFSKPQVDVQMVIVSSALGTEPAFPNSKGSISVRNRVNIDR